MGKFNGTMLKAYYMDGEDEHLIADTRDISINLTVAEIPTTTRDSGGWEEFIAGVRSWNGKKTGVVDLVTTALKTRVADLMTLAIARVPINVIFTTKTSGDKSFAGTVIITNVGASSAHEGENTWTSDIKGTGPLTIATIV